jgi:hypothetical protein
MGRWAYSNRWTVEDCKTITTQFLNEYNYFDGGVRLGELTWRRNGEKIGSIGMEISTVEDDEYIRFQYKQTDRNTGKEIELDYKALLDWTSCYFGGRRWWFICPLITNGRVCGRRVGSLHLAGSEYLGCRHCYNLTYKSCKENHQFDNFLKSRGVDPNKVRDLFKHKK